MKKISVPLIELQSDEYTRFQCMYGCPNYKRNPLCPPACPDFEWYAKLLHSYSSAMICYEQYDFESKQDLQKKKFEFQELLIKEEFRLKKEGHYYALSFTSGACILCGERNCNEAECNRKTIGRSPICSTGLNLKKILVDNIGLPVEELVRYWDFVKSNFDKISEHKELNVGLILY